MGEVQNNTGVALVRRDIDRANSGRLPLGADLLERMVSIYRDPTDIVGRAEKLSVVLQGIKAGHWEKPTVAIRKARECGDMALADRLKKALPAFTASGVFAPSRRKTNWVKPTGLLIIDIDGLESREKAEAVRDLLGKDPHVFAAFVSVSGKGVKAIVYIGAVADPAEFTAAWRAFAGYLKQKYGLDADPSGTDNSRLGFISDDPDIVVNRGPIRPFRERIYLPKPDTQPSDRSTDTIPTEWEIAAVQSAIAAISADCPYGVWRDMACAVKNGLGEEGFDVFDLWSATAPEKYDEAATTKLWDSLDAERPGGITVRTLFKRAAERGWVNPGPEPGRRTDVEVTDESDPKPTPKPWHGIQDQRVRDAIAGSLLEPMVQVLGSVAVPALPIQNTLPKAIVLAGTALSQPISEVLASPDLRRGLELARVVIDTAGGQGCNVWICQVAPSGAGKDLGYLPNKVASSEGVFVGHSGSAEGLADAMITNGGGLIVISELQNYLNQKRWEYAACSFLTQGFNGAQAKVALSRRSGGARDLAFCLPNLLASVQPEVLAGVADKLLMDSGFLPRFLFSYIPSRQAWRPRASMGERQPLNDAFRSYRSVQARVAVPEGYLQDVLDEFLEHDAPLPGHYCRLVNEYGPRLAVMLAVDPKNPHVVVITDDHWRRAGLLIRWFFSMAEQVLVTIGEPGHVKAMEDRFDRMLAFVRKHPEGVAKKHFSQNFHRGTTAAERDRDIQELRDRGLLTVQTVGKRTVLRCVK